MTQWRIDGFLHLSHLLPARQLAGIFLPFAECDCEKMGSVDMRAKPARYGDGHRHGCQKRRNAGYATEFPWMALSKYLIPSLHPGHLPLQRTTQKKRSWLTPTTRSKERDMSHFQSDMAEREEGPGIKDLSLLSLSLNGINFRLTPG